MKILLKALLMLVLSIACCQCVNAQQSFKVVPLGVKGGLDESNLSAYLVAAAGDENYVCFDAGTLYSGIAKTNTKKVFGLPPGNVLKQDIKAYFISHAHLDHVAGLIINSPADTSKNIYGTEQCLSYIQQHYFSWQTWANFGDKGEKPALGKYHYMPMNLESSVAIEQTSFTAKAYALSHSAPYASTAFLLSKNNSYVLYLGDTGADSIEHSNKLQLLWNAIAPLINAKQLKGIFIEVSYPNEQPVTKLFGHLTPALLMQEMYQLSNLCTAGALKNLPVIITHIKPEGDNEYKIKEELKALNTLHLRLIYPQQGKPFLL